MLVWLVSLAALSDYYADLGVDRGASKSEIRRAFRKAAVQWHPDKMVGKSKSEQDQARARFIEINDAHGVLSDDKERRSYDHKLRYGGGGSAQYQQQQRPGGFYYHNGQHYYHQPNRHYQQQQQYYRRRQQQHAQQSGGLVGAALQLVFTVLTIAVPLLLVGMPRLLAAFDLDGAAREGRGTATERGAPPPPAPPAPPPLPLPREELSLLRAKELKSRLRYYRVDASACVEKGDFVALLVKAQNAARRREADLAGAL